MPRYVKTQDIHGGVLYCWAAKLTSQSSCFLQPNPFIYITWISPPTGVFLYLKGIVHPLNKNSLIIYSISLFGVFWSSRGKQSCSNIQYSWSQWGPVSMKYWNIHPEMLLLCCLTFTSDLERHHLRYGQVRAIFMLSGATFAFCTISKNSPGALTQTVGWHHRSCMCFCRSKQVAFHFTWIGFSCISVIISKSALWALNLPPPFDQWWVDNDFILGWTVPLNSFVDDFVVCVAGR